MSENGNYISREAVLSAIWKTSAEHDVFFPAIILDAIKSIPAADVRPVVLCRDCVYWQKPQVKQNNGTYRDYEQGEGNVTVDVGINVGSFCAKYNTKHQNRIPQFMGENDFCSKGYKLKEG